MAEHWRKNSAAVWTNVKERVQPKMKILSLLTIMSNISSMEYKICYLKNLLAIFSFVHPVRVIQTTPDFPQIIFWSDDDFVWGTEQNLGGYSLSNQIKTLIHSSILVPKSNRVTHNIKPHWFCMLITTNIIFSSYFWGSLLEEKVLYRNLRVPSGASYRTFQRFTSWDHFMNLVFI